MQISDLLARYVEALENCAAKTSRAEDRALYEKYLAHAAGLLALAVNAEPREEELRP